VFGPRGSGRGSLSFVPRSVEVNHDEQIRAAASADGHPNLFGRTHTTTHVSASPLVQAGDTAVHVRLATRPPSETSHRACSGTPHARLLLQTFRPTQAQWDDSAYFKCQAVEQTYQIQTLHNADTQDSQTSSDCTRLGNINRHERCLLSCSNALVSKEVFKICCRGESLPVQESPLRVVHCTPTVHAASRNTGEMGQTSRHQPDCLYRRLVDTPPRQRDSPASQRRSSEKGNRTGVDSQPREVRPNSPEEIRLLRDDHRPEHLPSETQTETNRSPVGTNSTVKSVGVCTTSYAVAYTGHSRVSRRSCPLREAPETSISVLPHSLGTACSHSQTDRSLSGHGRDESVSNLVEFPECSERGADLDRTSGDYGSHGCIPLRLGCTLCGRPDQGPLVNTGVNLTHKPARNVGSNTRISTFPGFFDKQTCVTQIRQHHGVGVSEASGRSQISNHDAGDKEVAFVDEETQCNTLSRTHFNRLECAGRQIESRGQTSSGGVVTKSPCVSSSVQLLLPTGSRPVRDQMESQASEVCESLSRPSGVRSRCHGDGLDPVPDHLPVSSYSCVDERGAEAADLQGYGHAHSSAQHTQTLSCTTVQTNFTKTSASRHKSQTFVARSHSDKLSSKRKVAEPSRLDRIRSAIKDKGFSSKVATLAAEPQRNSTTSRYDYIWSKFAQWYKILHKSSPYRAKITTVADYLMQLHERKLAFATILTHKSAIAVTIKAVTGVDISSDEVIVNLLRKFKTIIPKTVHDVPDWDLSVVLKALTRPPFEPLNEASTRFLTMKTLFLTTWASAARVSEIHALSVKPGHFQLDKSNRHIDLTADKNFLG